MQNQNFEFQNCFFMKKEIAYLAVVFLISN